MEVALGVSVTPTAIYLALTEGDHADGVTVDEDMIAVDAGTAPAEAAITAIQQARGAADAGGYRVASIGVTCSAQADAIVVGDALSEHRIGDVMLVSGFLAAAALTQTVGKALGYPCTALTYFEPGSMTLAVVDSATGAIGAVHRRRLPDDPSGVLAEAMTELALLETRPGGVHLVGAGVDIRAVKTQLEALTPLPVTVPEEPATALAQGAAVAAAHAPLFTMSTQALAYSRDPGTGAIDPDGLALRLASGGDTEDTALAYSALPDGGGHDDAAGPDGIRKRLTRTPVLIGSATAAIVVIASVALVVSLVLQIQPVAQLLPNVGSPEDNPQRPATPQTIQQPAPVVQPVPPPEAAPPVAPAPEVPAPQAPAPEPLAPQAPAPAPQAPPEPPAPRAVAPPAPALPAAPPPAEAAVPEPQAPAVPEAPAPAPVPLPIPIPVVVPQLPVPKPEPPTRNPPKKTRPSEPALDLPPVWQPKAPERPKTPKRPDPPKTPKQPEWQPSLPDWQPESPKAPKAPKAPKQPQWQPPKLPDWQPKSPDLGPKLPHWQPKAPSHQPKGPSLRLPDLKLPF
ncbi:hypothetical protein [Mycobacterium sp. 1274756.6]|uniref:DUF7159 family protein n=1 Tax=Mycobacterium sp. 1274756.6 TaxID=1834076 RepID=UPI0007FD90FC|nr:hypothetical protein [Mycobacterium sp. 1274756.6]OBJ67787.1 hypothetical protein A5643_14825 [Mycobacterium sp. 1274756.6]